MDEKTYFNNDKGVSVTSARFIVDDQTYAMSGVTSVKKFIQKPSIVRMILSILLILFGVVSLLGAFSSGNISMVIMPIVLLLIGAALWFFNRKQFIVLLHTASGESQALKTNDSSLVDSVVEALNTAIIERG